MALSNSTLHRLADVLSKDVAEHITEDDRFFQLMVDLIPDAVSAKLGAIDEEVLFELSVCIAERLRLIGV